MLRLIACFSNLRVSRYKKYEHLNFHTKTHNTMSMRLRRSAAGLESAGCVSKDSSGHRVAFRLDCTADDAVSGRRVVFVCKY